jgi:hypothetical protein
MRALIVVQPSQFPGRLNGTLIAWPTTAFASIEQVVIRQVVTIVVHSVVIVVQGQKNLALTPVECGSPRGLVHLAC